MVPTKTRIKEALQSEVNDDLADRATEVADVILGRVSGGVVDVVSKGGPEDKVVVQTPESEVHLDEDGVRLEIQTWPVPGRDFQSVDEFVEWLS